jgi:hypothetical protein
MIQALINDAKLAAGSAAGKFVVKYLARACVALPFIVALGFVTAAITLMLVDQYGGIEAFWIVAGGFTLIGLVATLALTLTERGREIAERRAAELNAARAASARAAAQAPMMLLGALLSTSVGPGVVAGGAKALVRNLPLVALAGLITLLMKMKTQPTDSAGAVSSSAGGRSNGAHPPMPNDSPHEAV